MYIKFGGLGALDDGAVCTSQADCKSGHCCGMPNGFAYCMPSYLECLNMIARCAKDPNWLPICKAGSGSTPPVIPPVTPPVIPPYVPPVPKPPATTCPAGTTGTPPNCVASPPASSNTIFGMSPMVAGAVGLLGVLAVVKVVKG